VFGAFFAPTAVFDEFEFVGSVGFIFFGKIVLGAADGTAEGDKDSGRLFCFSHGRYCKSNGGIRQCGN